MTHIKNEPSLSAVPQEKIEKLTRKVAKSLMLDDEVATALIYNEWEMVEALFARHKKVKAVHKHLLQEIEGTYRGTVCSN